MQQIVKLIYRISLPLLIAYVFLLISPQQLGTEAAQRTMHTRIFWVIFLGLFSWGTGNAILGSGRDTARFWKNLGAFGYQRRSLFTNVSSILGSLAGLVGFTIMMWDLVTRYLPNWIIYRPLIVGFALVVEAIGLIKFVLDILNTIDTHKENN